MYLSTAVTPPMVHPTPSLLSSDMDTGVMYSMPVQLTDRNRKKLFFDANHPLSNALLLRQCIPE